MNTKIFTIGYTHTKSKATRKTKTSPKITLSGDWLKTVGFDTGQKVEVQIKKNQLIIKILHHDLF